MKNLLKITIVASFFILISINSYSQNWQWDKEKAGEPQSVMVELYDTDGYKGKCYSLTITANTYAEFCGKIEDKVETYGYDCTGEVWCKPSYQGSFGVKVKEVDFSNWFD